MQNHFKKFWGRNVKQVLKCFRNAPERQARGQGKE